jgi:hypothetical protein
MSESQIYKQRSNSKPIFYHFHVNSNNRVGFNSNLALASSCTNFYVKTNVPSKLSNNAVLFLRSFSLNVIDLQSTDPNYINNLRSVQIRSNSVSSSKTYETTGIGLSQQSNIIENVPFDALAPPTVGARLTMINLNLSKESIGTQINQPSLFETPFHILLTDQTGAELNLQVANTLNTEMEFVIYDPEGISS